MKPFRTIDEDVDDNLYYIKRDDLISLSRAWVNENKGLVIRTAYEDFKK